MDQWLDGARPPRQGEELDTPKLELFLHQQLPQTQGGKLVIEQFPSGFSNLTYLLRCGELEMVLRRPPFGNRVKSAHDMAREHQVLSGLQEAYPLAPKTYLYCDDEEILGAPFYVMERRKGVVLRRKLPRGLDLRPVIAGRLSEHFIESLADLHTLDYEGAGLSDLGHPEGYVKRQVEGWIKRYTRAQTDSWQEFEEMGAWMLDNMPCSSGAALVHNDYKYDNVLLDPNDLTRLVAVLDWEMCTLGDPLMDLGTTLAYWVQADDPPALIGSAFGPTAVAGSWTRQQLAEHYASRTGADISNLVFYMCFGYYKLGVIVQQIYYRYFKGHTQDPRFAQLNQMVGMLGKAGLHTLNRGSI